MDVKNFTFKTDVNLFDVPVLMIFRNRDKKYIASLDHAHFNQMIDHGYDPGNNEDILLYLKVFKYL